MSYFKNVPEIKYEGRDSKNPFAFKFYNPEEKIMGKTMREQLKFALSWWHTLTAVGSDPFGDPVMSRNYGESDPMKRAFARIDAGFDFMQKLGIEYYCFHDVDIAPAGNSLAELKQNLAEVTGYLKNKMSETGIKLLWGTANCFSHPRYMSGAATSPNADSFAYAAAQIKNAIDSTIELGGSGYVFWGGREGYDTLINTNMELELKNLATMLTISRDYGREKGFKGDFYIEPKPKEPTKHQYDFDAATAIGFLRQNGLDKDFRMNIESNHATLAGHSFQHELRVSRVNGMFGSIDANQGDDMLGWDVDMFPSNVYNTTMCCYEIIKAGGFTNGGLNFDAKVRRSSYRPEDIALAYILGMDSFALGLRIASAIIQDGTIDKFVEDRYSGYNSGIGAKIAAGNVTLEELEAYALKTPSPVVESGQQEYLESCINRLMFTI